jgi:hypothetical protein
MIGITPKGRAYIALAAVRDRWDSLTPDQKQECAELVARLSLALRAERLEANRSRPLPLVGRISA